MPGSANRLQWLLIRQRAGSAAARVSSALAPASAHSPFCLMLHSRLWPQACAPQTLGLGGRGWLSPLVSRLAPSIISFIALSIIRRCYCSSILPMGLAPACIFWGVFVSFFFFPFELRLVRWEGRTYMPLHVCVGQRQPMRASSFFPLCVL